MNARERILSRLRAAPAAPAAQPDVAAWFAAHRRDEDLAQRIARLRRALEASHAEVHETTNDDWADLLLRLIAARRVRSLLIGEGTPHGATLESRRAVTQAETNGCRSGLARERNSEAPISRASPLPQNIHAHQVDRLPAADLQLIRYAQAVETFRETLFDGVDASLTLARSAVAETGSLILWPDASEPRLMSLVPPLHFVLLDAATVHPDLDAALRAERWQEGLPTNALLVSGPSKTADIQQTLAYGAHGPRELVVLVVQTRHGEGGRT